MNFQMGELKKEVLKSTIQRYSLIMGDLRERLRSVAAVREDSDSAYVHVKPPRIESIEEISLLSNQIQMAVHEFDILRKMENFVDHVHTFIELGSLVLTSRGAYFIAVDLDHFKVQGKTVTGIPVQSPFYFAMKGKREGESFHYQGLNYDVKEIL